MGNRRRLAQTKDDAAHRTEHDANFFDPNNAEYTATREQLAMDTLEELLHWLMEENGSVGILGIRLLNHGSRRCHQLECCKKKDDSEPRTSNRGSQHPISRKYLYR